MEELKIAENLSFPLNAVTQTLAQIGRRGAGKTYLATVIAEQMLDARAQVIVLDPVGNWYGLRIAADGHSKGKDIFVIGGEHGDIPLPPEGGARIGQLLAEKRVSAIIDLSGFRQGERKRFAADFAEEFFHLKKSQRSAVHVFIEEAQLFIPQMCRPDEARMLGAFENIVRLGRNYGIGTSLISQRPQSVNKEVLSQVECLCVLQVNGTHERKALDAWVQEAGADRSLIGKLPGLARGEGFVWSPAWLRAFKRVKFARKTTYDASATPEVGRTTKAATLSAVDVAALEHDLRDVIASAEKDDPKALKREIAELRKQLAQVPGVDTHALDELRLDLTGVREDADRWKQRYEYLWGMIEDTRDRMNPVLAKPVEAAPFVAVAPFRNPLLLAKPVVNILPDHLLPDGDGEKMPKACRAVLTALAQHGEAAKAKVAALTGYAVNGGGFNNALSELRTKGWMTGSDRLTLTTLGRAALGAFDPLPTGADLLAMWNRKLGRAERSILDVLARNGELSKERLAGSAGYAPNGGGFNNALSSLRTLGLIEGRSELRLAADFAEALGR